MFIFVYKTDTLTFLNLIEKHKALIITFLLTGIVVFGMFSIQLKQHQTLITESYYELEPEITEKEQQQIEDLKTTSTNKAFNEDQEYKDLMRNFKTVSANDFERTTKAIEKAKTVEKSIEKTSANDAYASSNDYAINAKETESYKKLQEKLKKRLENKQQADAHAKSRSTLTYSLKGRTLLNYKIPRYLCERGGKIVVTIRVNAAGNVTDASINGSSNSNNQCLIDSAITYSKDIRFNVSQKNDQIGTITFLFKGKN
ncbi:hypothetical protein [uncultured Winogradskyella sp.]|uniref:hypothetical protein n=1 Tax=uncultured Winogradskyella sp. TaxID=395353 RepID=UPI0030DCAA2D